MKIEIKSRFTGSILFAHEADDNTLRTTLEKAVSVKTDLYGANLYGANLYGADLYGANLGGADLGSANLYGANLYGANLYGANLYGADLRSAYLRGANLDGADLGGADLGGADLRSAYLRGANLDGANLGGANLYGAKLIGERPILQIGPIGSRADYLIAFLTDAGIKVHAGCWFGSRDEFAAEVAKTHGQNIHAQEYAAALALIDAHAKLWPMTDHVARGEA